LAGRPGTSPPRVTIEVKICDVTEEENKTLGFGWLPGNRVETTTSSPGTNTFLRTMTGILTDQQFRLVINALKQRGGTDLLAAPRVTTLSGRPAQIQVTKAKAVVTGLNYQTNRIEGPKGTKDEVITNYTTTDMGLARRSM
jgi:type II secretory pathway component GspD/PulD (secretin)